jgi:low temperature requirement protein LtrA
MVSRGLPCRSLEQLDPPPFRPRPAAHTAAQMNTWLELFYDLVFVAAILVMSTAVSHLHQPARIAWVVAVFVSVWWVWLLTTMFTNRFRTHDMTHRLLVLTQMFLVILVAMEAHEGVVRDGVYLSVTYAALIGTVAIMYARQARTHDRAAKYAMTRAGWLAASGVVFILASAVPGSARGVVWVVGLALSVEPALRRASPTDGAPAVDEHHLLERMGALTIIVCGEAFVKVAIAVSSGSVGEVDVIALAFQFALTFAIWLIYFEDIPHAGIRPGRLPAWLGLHLVLQLAMAGTAIGVSKLVKTGPLDHLPVRDILEITATLATLYLALALLGLCTRRRPVGPLLILRLSTCVVTVVVGVAAWQIARIDLAEGVAALTVVAIVHAAIGVRLDNETEVLEPA